MSKQAVYVTNTLDFIICFGQLEQSLLLSDLQPDLLMGHKNTKKKSNRLTGIQRTDASKIGKEEKQAIKDTKKNKHLNRRRDKCKINNEKTRTHKQWMRTYLRECA